MRERLKSFSSPEGQGFKKDQLSLVFMGTPEFARPVLEKITGHEKVVAVVTQPDRPAGRGKKLQPSPVKVAAHSKNIPVYQPQNLEDPHFLRTISSLQPDLLVVVAFGEMLSQTVLRIPRIFPINLHPSLLPKYRGPAPIPWTLMRGECETGVTVQRIRKKADTGEIILQAKVSIDPEDTCGTLSQKLSQRGADILVEAIGLIKENKITLRPQKGKASYAPKITKQMAHIDWIASALEIHNLARALNPRPGAFTTFSRNGKSCTLKIWRTAVWADTFYEDKTPPGTVVQIQKEQGLVVKTGKGALLIREVQLPDRARISAYDFVKGYHGHKGFFLGG